MKGRTIQDLAADLWQDTVWPENAQRQPPASVFHLEVQDLKSIQVDTDLRVYHRDCGGGVLHYCADSVDPIMSKYVCYCGDVFCSGAWLRDDLLKRPDVELKKYFYTELREDSSELEVWPEKLCEVSTGPVCYTTVRPMTRTELLESRVKRLLSIREKYR